jgi:SLOG in TRPM, prokaryote/Protein of unknown function (DUF4231)
MLLTGDGDGHVEEPGKPADPDAPGPRVVRPAAREEVPGRLAELGLRPPRPVVVLVGGADGLGDAGLARLRPLFEEGLAPLADSLGACVVDGGTDAGVMALIGRARTRLGAGFPLVGVTASGTVEPAGGAGDRADASPLEPNHTHQVLVPGSSWGEESPWLADVATWLAADGPSVTVVVNGGEVTAQDAARSVDAGRPVLVVAGSGRAADDLAAALRQPAGDRPAARLARSGLVQAVELDDGPHALARALAGLLATAPLRPVAAGGDPDALKVDFEAMIEALRLSELRRRFLRLRWLDELLWVEGRANYNRRRYFFWRLLTIVGGVIVPALVTVNLNDAVGAPVTWLTFVLSLLVAVSAAVEGFFRYGERWRHYRRTAELLKTEGWQFLQLTGHYRRHAAHALAYPLFASRVEHILQQDVDAYITTVAAEPADRQPGNPPDQRQGDATPPDTPGS